MYVAMLLQWQWRDELARYSLYNSGSAGMADERTTDSLAVFLAGLLSSSCPSTAVRISVGFGHGQVTYNDGSGREADAEDTHLAGRSAGLELRVRAFSGGRTDCQVWAGYPRAVFVRDTFDVHKILHAEPCACRVCLHAKVRAQFWVGLAGSVLLAQQTELPCLNTHEFRWLF